jgi:YD repeat-containing protein
VKAEHRRRACSTPNTTNGAHRGALRQRTASPAILTQAQIDAIWEANAIKHTYDAAGRRTSTTDANGNKTLFYYDADGRLTHTINALGEVQENRYNPLGQQKQKIDYGTRLSATTLGTLGTLSGGGGSVNRPSRAPWPGLPTSRSTRSRATATPCAASWQAPPTPVPL